MTVAVNEVLTLSPRGRASREAYWFAVVLSLAVLAAAGSAAGVAAILPPGLLGTGLQILSGVLTVFALIFLVAAVIRRLHDLAYSGAAAWFLIIPGVNLICLAALGIVSGSPSFNRFGPSPLAIRTISPREAEPAREEAVQAADEAPAAAQPLPMAAAVEAPRETAQSEASADAQDRDLEPAELIYQSARIQCMGESMTVQLQVKVAMVEKLRRLQKKQTITPEAFERWKRRIMSI